MDQAVRNRLRNVVTQCRRLLEDTTAQALQGRFGIYAAGRNDDVQVEDGARMGHLTDEDRALRRDLLDHLEHIKAVGLKPREALEQLVREIAFTHLNRLCAYRMMEARGLIRETVSRGLKSQGFFFYLADHPDDEKFHKAGQQDAAYRNFLDWLGGTLSAEIGVLFNPNDPANRLYPPQRVLDEVLGLINGDDLAGIWTEDETIGWVYQYFTPKELRDQARKESQAPRNSYELAFRNQFYTPRYVVEFLTDNTLGRTWYEMRKGQTALKDSCRYLVRRPAEVFLAEGQEPPDDLDKARDDFSQDELLKQPVYISHRPKKDPREIRILDPACGSGHFLLYCFDLLQVIYEEAYDDPYLGAALRKDYPSLADLRQAVPGLILKHNLHGIDIDLRATQIAALALWLRCQRAYRELGLKNGERPKITRSNVVCAEPMPGETDLLKEFTATLQPRVLGQLLETIFEKMKLAGEAGSLLKIEEEIRQAAQNAKDEFIAWKKHQEKAKGHLFPDMVKRDQPNLLDFADLTDEAFLDRVEQEIVDALRRYATQAENGRGFRRKLFAEDAARGFAFIDLCRNRYDVLLMNPPFGVAPSPVFTLLKRTMPSTYTELYAAFVKTALDLARNDGRVGAITSRAFLYISRLATFRAESLVSRVDVLLDLAGNVMDDALVEACAYTVSPLRTFDSIVALDAREEKRREDLGALVARVQDQCCPHIYVAPWAYLSTLPSGKFLYYLPRNISDLLRASTVFEPEIGTVRQGMGTFDDFRFVHLLWEVPHRSLGHGKVWEPLSKGGPFAKYYSAIHLAVNWWKDGAELCEINILRNGQTAQVRQASDYWRRGGCTYSKRSAKGFSARALPRGCIMAGKGPAIISQSTFSERYFLGWLNSRLITGLIELQANAYEFNTGILKNLPWRTPDECEHAFIGQLAHATTLNARTLHRWDETDPNFVFLPFASGSLNEQVNQASTERQGLVEQIARSDTSITSAIDRLYGVDSSVLGGVQGDDGESVDDDSDDQDAELTRDLPREYSEFVLSGCIGVAFGRWDIRLAAGERQPAPLPDPFDPLPVCPPGMLQGPDGLPAKPEDVPADYPIRIDWDGILVDDPEHPDDIVHRVREVLEVLWKDRAEAIEKEACEILGVRELRDYFRKPTSGGFWMDHVRRYSKSRRKAPIYWYLRSARGSYGLWLYYHRLDKDILFKALLNYVEPKIRLEEDRLNTLRARREAAGKSGREAKQIEKAIDRQEQFVAELQDFRDKLRRAADLRIAPDLNDGVVLNIAPLWKLVPWKEAKHYWEALQEGKYDWSHIAYQLWPDRVKQKCRTDRSIAIAHGLEDLCEAPPPRSRRAADEVSDEGPEDAETEEVDVES